MKYAVIAAMGIAGTAIAAPVQQQGEQGQGNGQGGGEGYGNPEPTSTVPAWTTPTPSGGGWPHPSRSISGWPTSMPWGTPGPSGYPGGGWPPGWPTSSVSTPPAATSNPALPFCPDTQHLPNADLAPIECINVPNVPEINPGGPIEPLERNTGPKRRSVLDWFKGNNKDNEDD